MQEKIQDAEQDFDTLMSRFCIHGDCKLNYQEKHPEGMNYFGVLTCTANLDTHRYAWQMLYRPASQTEDDFVNAIKARLFDTLISLANEGMEA